MQGNKNETEGAAAEVQAAAEAASAPMAAAGGADLSAEREADEFLKNFLANVAKEGSETSSDDGAAVAGLLGPFVSKEMLYPPLREIRERVCFFFFHFLFTQRTQIKLLTNKPERGLHHEHTTVPRVANEKEGRTSRR